MKKVLNVLGVALLLLGMSFSQYDKKIVVIDAGHGGNDHGVVVDNNAEKAISLAIAKKVQSLFKDSEVEIVLLRDEDKFVPLTDRVAKIQKLNPDYVISLHIDSAKNTNLNGSAIYTSKKGKKHEASQALAQKFKNTDYFKDAQLGNANFILLRQVDCPSVIVEMGFLTNEADRANLSSENGQAAIAEAIASVIKS
ncbi:N-acetylmuramoyl-L-alanine amidase [Ornithobacterium rhinotracheale]|uniref:N-acetylmuramoyl-L-alanine amidase family protein n=1 Tax=Ornithobacterium rhinotracheale TaxID=28251 RepID=UPI00129CFDA3|nr:N-acetylmuramoyl-L-alanine amidase [Ornithobacterium rhinotracheale]MRJ11423.1 N-acetylmuramoyl-L-alanine amidase [Ornithobacterium rhinotracheale]